MALPDFVGIGTQRAGTTWLHNCLQEHPEVFLPPIKEIHFFDRNYERGIDWYKSFFENSPKEKSGEFTPNYLQEEKYIQRMFKVIPNALLIISLRNPVDRAYSAYNLFNEQFKNKSFREAFDAGGNIIRIGFYHQHLQVLFKYFSKDQVKIILYDDIKDDPQKVLKELYRFLLVDTSFTPDSLSKRYNQIIMPVLQKKLESLKLGGFVNLVKKTPVNEVIKKFHRYYIKKKIQNSDLTDRQYYTNIFHDDIIKLQDLINRDLSAWL